jgi:hypothetical protein
VEAFYLCDFCCKIMSPGQLCQGIYQKSPIGDNFRLICIKFSKICIEFSKKYVFLAKNKHVANTPRKKGDCLLSMMDSTTSEGWRHKINFKEDEECVQASLKIEFASCYASRFMHYKTWEYSQWFPGSNDQVADALSREMGRPDDKLTQILFTHTPSQVPSSFKILLLPISIVSWVTLLLLRLPVQQRYKEV